MKIEITNKIEEKETEAFLTLSQENIDLMNEISLKIQKVKENLITF
jgi:hypothetical protein